MILLITQSSRNVENIPHRVRQTTARDCAPSKCHPPPLNKPDRPLVVSNGYGLSENRPTAITPEIRYKRYERDAKTTVKNSHPIFLPPRGLQKRQHNHQFSFYQSMELPKEPILHRLLQPTSIPKRETENIQLKFKCKFSDDEIIVSLFNHTCNCD